MTQAQALAIMKTGVNVYLTGSAGAGKTYVLNQYIQYLKEHDISVAVTASTGIAATHMQGMTIHGWSGIGVRETLTDYDLEMMDEKQYLWTRFTNARVLIVDEISMLHAHRLDMVDRVCRKFKRNDVPFGGLQVILAGDLFQLPPVNKTNAMNNKDMVIHSHAWKAMSPAICYLTEQHRQDDDSFLSILNAIRSGDLDESHYELLGTRYNAHLGEHINPTKLYTHNKNVDAENDMRLGEMEGETKVFYMSGSGKDTMVEILKKSCLAQDVLYLKKGAEVMFVKNNTDGGYVNGTRGVVTDFDISGMPIVTLHNGKVIIVQPDTWAIEEDGKIKASVTQIPLRLAWAITIHKSQGMSMDSAEIDLANTFAYGMGYVALSRVRSLAGIRLIGFNPNALQVDPAILEFDKELRAQSVENEALFGKLKKEEQLQLEQEFMVRMGGTLQATKVVDVKTKKVKKIPSVLITKELLEQGMTIKEIAKERGCTEGTIMSHVEDIATDFPETDITHLKPKQKEIDAVKKAQSKLKADEKGKLTPLKQTLEKMGHEMTFDQIRLARLFI